MFARIAKRKIARKNVRILNVSRETFLTMEPVKVSRSLF
jgi:hypothetical protein